MSIITISLEREARGNCYDFLQSPDTRPIKWIEFLGIVRYRQACDSVAYGSLETYALSRAYKKKIYHSRLYDNNRLKVADLIHTLPTGEYEFILSKGFFGENLFVRLELVFFQREQG